MVPAFSRRLISNAVGSFARVASRCVAVPALAGIYGAAAWVSRRLARRRFTGGESGYILAVTTFHNPNWFHSHIRPLTRSGARAVLLVCDEPMVPTAGVSFQCPPRIAQVLLTRAGAKLVWTVRCAWRYRPDVVMGYHIFPCAVIALVAARLFGRPACYQMTSGPLEIEGGGWNAENRLLRALGAPSALVARLAAAVVREFDSLIVRGNAAAAYVLALGFERDLGIITGSVEPHGAWRDFGARSFDIAFVGRLTEYKRPDRFVAVVAAVVEALPAVRAVIVGDGPDMPSLRAAVAEGGLAANVEFLGQRSDVDELLAATKVFVLTSRWEGLSIAMLEAMAAGAVPVVADVGDLRDAIRVGVNGFLVAQDDIAAYADATVRLLTDAETWRACSAQATELARARGGTDAVAALWRCHLRGFLRTPGALQAASASEPTS
jgi:glycosyltransferase involved in cell wall biosynthesis